MTDVNSALRYFEEVKQRIIFLRNNRPFRFLNTSRRNAARWLDEMTWFEGFSENEVAQLESTLKVKFPIFFKLFLGEFGKSLHTFIPFRGLDVGSGDYLSRYQEAQDLLEECEVASFLTPDTVVFWFRQGYSFNYFIAKEVFDVPILQYVECDETPREVFGSFAEFLEAHLRYAEEGYQQSIEGGGHFLTVSDVGYSISRPAKNRNQRPLDFEDRFID